MYFSRICKCITWVIVIHYGERGGRGVLAPAMSLTLHTPCGRILKLFVNRLKSHEKRCIWWLWTVHRIFNWLLLKSSWQMTAHYLMNRKFLIIVSQMDCDTTLWGTNMNVKDIKRQARGLSCTLLENTLNTLINAEFDAFIGATRYERKSLTRQTFKLYFLLSWDLIQRHINRMSCQ